MEKQLNTSGEIPRIDIIVILEEIQQDGTRMMRIAFQMPKNQELRNDIVGQAWKESGMEILTTIRKGSGNVQPTRWYSKSKRLVFLLSTVSVP